MVVGEDSTSTPLIRKRSTPNRLAKLATSGVVNLAQRFGVYYAGVKVGTPASTTVLLLALDTTASDLVIPQGIRNASYKPSASSSYTDLRQTSTSGNESYPVALDHVQYYNHADISADQQAFLLAADTQYASIGLGLPSTSEVPSASSSAARNKKVIPTLALNSLDTTKYSGRGYRVPVIEGVTAWALEITNYMSGASNLLTLKTNAYIDSTARYTDIPRQAAAAIYAKIPGTIKITTDEAPDLYWYPCNTTVEPGFVFNSGGRRAHNLDPKDLNDMSMQNLGNPGGLCHGTIRGKDMVDSTGAKKAILSTSFLVGRYSEFKFSDSYYSDGRPSLTFYHLSSAATKDDATTATMLFSSISTSVLVLLSALSATASPTPAADPVDTAFVRKRAGPNRRSRRLLQASSRLAVQAASTTPTTTSGLQSITLAFLQNYPSLLETLGVDSFALILRRPINHYVLSTIAFNTLDLEKYSGKGVRVPVIEEANAWAVEITNYMSGTSNLLTLRTNAYIDTLSAATYLPKTAAAAIYASIPGSTRTSSAGGVDTY
ncbi:hypothetical protein JCM8547_006119 [Rhodosporidiobolus lusitaniae]